MVVVIWTSLEEEHADPHHVAKSDLHEKKAGRIAQWRLRFWLRHAAGEGTSIHKRRKKRNNKIKSKEAYDLRPLAKFAHADLAHANATRYARRLIYKNVNALLISCACHSLVKKRHVRELRVLPYVKPRRSAHAVMKHGRP